MRRKICFLAYCVWALAIGANAEPSHASINIVSFAPSVYDSDTASMDSTLGITGFAIEDFEDTSLISGLSYTLANPASGPFSSLPATFNVTSSPASTSYWDGVNVLLNTATNTIGGTGDRSDEVMFNVSGGANSIGFGLANFQSLGNPFFQYPIADHELLVNGVSHGKLETLPGWAFVFQRNLYLRIDATDGDVINTVTFRNVDGLVSTDVLIFDHVAVDRASTDVIPEPTSLIVWSLLGYVWTAAGCRRRGRVA